MAKVDSDIGEANHSRRVYDFEGDTIGGKARDYVH